MATLTLKKKKDVGNGNFEYTYECFCSPNLQLISWLLMEMIMRHIKMPKTNAMIIVQGQIQL